MGAARELVDRFYGCLADGDLAGVTACFAPACVTETPAGPLPPDEHERFIGAFKAGLPDAHMHLVKTVEHGDEIFVEGRFRGTHRADLVTPQGTLPASGRALDLPYADYFRVASGKIVEHHVFWDQAAMLGQLGASEP
jgi:ketosteroid isomerase-like protein